MARVKFVAGNWKMNTTREQAVALAKGVAAGAAKNAVTLLPSAFASLTPCLAAAFETLEPSVGISMCLYITSPCSRMAVLPGLPSASFCVGQHPNQHPEHIADK